MTDYTVSQPSKCVSCAFRSAAGHFATLAGASLRGETGRGFWHTPAMNAESLTVPGHVPQPASLLQRIFAFLWDYLPILGWLLLVMAFGVGLGALAPAFAQSVFGNPQTGQLAGFCLVTLPVTLYFALQESSARHASWGKRKRGLVVVNLLGDGIGFMQALARTLLKFVPWELSHTFIIHASIAAQAGQDPPDWASAALVMAWVLVLANLVSFFMSPRRQTLYDRIAGTQVMRAAR